MSKITGTRLTKELVKYQKEQYANKLCLSNIYLFDWESDVLSLTKEDVLTEFEVKVSRSDFLADFAKTQKHQDLKYFGINTPNKFYYVVPKDMIAPDDVPEYAGLIYFIRPGWFKVVKEAPVINNDDVIKNYWEELAMKLYYKL